MLKTKTLKMATKKKYAQKIWKLNRNEIADEIKITKKNIIMKNN